jgi:hypothetical protein
MAINNRTSTLIFVLVIFVLAFFSTSVSAAEITSLNIEDLKRQINASLQGSSKSSQVNVLVITVRLVGFLMGIVLFISGLLRIRKNAENPNNYSISSCIWMLISGSLLISLGTFYNVISSSMGASLIGDTKSILAVNAHISLASGTQSASGFAKFVPTETGQTILAFIYFIGIVSFVKGIFLLKDLGSPQGQQAGLSKPITHIMGGVVAMNILKFSCMVGVFIGSDIICLTGA